MQYFAIIGRARSLLQVFRDFRIATHARTHARVYVTQVDTLQSGIDRLQLRCDNRPSVCARRTERRVSRSTLYNDNDGKSGRIIESARESGASIWWVDVGRIFSGFTESCIDRSSCGDPIGNRVTEVVCSYKAGRSRFPRNDTREILGRCLSVN